MRQLGATESRSIKNGKNGKIASPTKGLITPRDHEKSFYKAGIDRLAWGLAVSPHMGEIAGTTEVFIGHLPQAPCLAQHTSQRGEG